MNNIDTRIVELEFDNKEFESNIQQSLKSLEELKKGLELDKCASSLRELERAANDFSLDGIEGEVSKIGDLFGSLGGMLQMSFLGDFAGKIERWITSTVKALTIDPITSGFEEFETQTNAVQTILNNILGDYGYDDSGRAKALGDINEALSELNLYADKTIYNFTHMTTAIGRFAASGVNLESSVAATKGISNLAAFLGATPENAQSAYNMFAQAISAGHMSAYQWNSLRANKMLGKQFEDALIRTATNMGATVTVKETGKNAKGKNVTEEKTYGIADYIDKVGDIKTSLEKGWLTDEILLETLKHFSGETSVAELKAQGYTETQIEEIMRLGEEATKAATEVKTATQLMDTLKEAAQSGWTQTWQTIIGDYDEAKKLWTGIGDFVGGILDGISKRRNDLLGEWKELGGRSHLILALMNIREILTNIFGAASKGFRNFFPETTSKQLLDFTNGIQKAVSGFLHWTRESENLEKIKMVFSGIGAVAHLVTSAIKGLWNAFTGLLGEAMPVGDSLLDIVAVIGSLLTKVHDAILGSETWSTVWSAFTGVLKNVVGFVTQLVKLNVGKAFKAFGILGEYFSGKNNLSDTFNNLTHVGFSRNWAEGIIKFAYAIKNVGSKVPDILNRIKERISGLFSKLKDWANKKDISGAITSWISSIGERIPKTIKWFGGFISSIKDFFKKSELFQKATSKIKSTFGTVTEWFGDKFDKFQDVFSKFTQKFDKNGDGTTTAIELFSGLGEKISEKWNLAKETLKTLFTSTIPDFFLVTIPGWVTKVKNGIQNSKLFQSIAGFLAGLWDSFKQSEVGSKIAAKLETMWGVIRDFGIAIGAFFSSDNEGDEGIKDKIKRRFNAVGLALSEWWGETGEKLGSTWENIKTFFGSIGEFFKNLFGGKDTSSVAESAASESESVSESSSAIGGFISEAIKKLGSINMKDVTTASGVGLLAASAFAVGAHGILDLKLGGLFGKVGKFFTGLGKDSKTVSKGIASFLKNLGKSESKKNADTIGTTLLKIAGAIFMVVAALAIISSLPTENIGSSALLLAGIAAGLVAMVFILKKIDSEGSTGDSIYNLVKGLIGLTVLIRILAKMDESAMAKGTFILGGLMALLVIFMNLTRGSNNMSTGFNFLGFAAGLFVMYYVIKKLAKMDPKDIQQGMLWLGIMMGALAVFINFVSGTGVKGKTGMLGFAIMIGVLTYCAIQLGKLDIESLAKGVGAVSILMLVMGLMVRLVSGTGLKQTGGLIFLAAAIAALGLVAKKLGEMDRESMIYGIGAIVALILSLTIMMKLTKNVKLRGLVLALAGLGVALFMMYELYANFPDNPDLAKVNAIISLMNAMRKMMLYLGIILVIFSKVGFNFKAGLSGLGILLLGIIGITATLLLIGAALVALDKDGTKTEQYLDRAILVCEKIGKAIHALLFGALFGMDADETMLGRLGTGLSEMMTNMEGFFTSIANVKEDSVAGAKNLAKVMGILTGESILVALGGLATIFIDPLGINSLPAFAQKISATGTILAGFPNQVKQFDDAAVKGVENLSTILKTMSKTEVSNAWDGVGTALASILNIKPDASNPMALFSEYFSEPALAFFESCKSVDESMVTGVDNVAHMIETLNSVKIGNDWSTIWGSFTGWLGGIAESIFGKHDLDGFISGLGDTFSELGVVLDIIAGIDVSEEALAKVNTVLGVAQSISELEKNLEGQGGLEDKFVGIQSLSAFSGGIPKFGEAMNSFITEVEKVKYDYSKESDDSKKMAAVIKIAENLAALERGLRSHGGFMGKFLGEADFNTFATQIKDSHMGEAISGFLDECRAIAYQGESDDAAVDNVMAVLTKLAEFEKSIEAQGGIADFFSGSKSLGGFSKSMVDLSTGVSSFSVSMKDVKGGVGDVERAFKIMNTFRDKFNETFGEGWEAVWSRIWGGSWGASAARSNMNDVFKSMGEFANGILEFTTSVTSTGTVTDQQIQNGFDLMKRFGEFVSSNDIKVPTSLLGSSLLTPINSIGSSMQSFGLGLQALKKGASNMTGEGLDWHELESIITGFNGLAQKIDSGEISTENIETAASIIANSYVKVLRETMVDASNTDIIGTAGEALGVAGWKGADSTRGSWINTGRNFSLGLAQGIKDYAFYVRVTAYNAAVAAINAARSAMRIASPSKVGSEIGMYWDLGMAQGIDTYANAIEHSSENAAHGAINSAKGMLAGLSSEMAFGMDPNPVIRPVVDLDNVIAGMNSVDGMFSNTRAINADLFSGSFMGRNVEALSYNDGRLDGSSNRDVVSAIMDLSDRFNMLSDAVTNMQLVLDSGVLVGRLGQKMDNQLGILAGRRERGN